MFNINNFKRKGEQMENVIKQMLIKKGTLLILNVLVDTHFMRFKNLKFVYTQCHSFENVKQNLTD